MVQKRKVMSHNHKRDHEFKKPDGLFKMETLTNKVASVSKSLEKYL